MRYMPEDVLDPSQLGVPDGAVITSALMIVEFVVPSDSDDDMAPSLWIFRDSVSGAWKHLGMLQVLSDDIRDDFRYQPPDAEDDNG